MDPQPAGSGLSFLAKFIRRYYAPLLLKPVVKGSIIMGFTGLLISSVISMQHIQLGLGKSRGYALNVETLMSLR